MGLALLKWLMFAAAVLLTVDTIRSPKAGAGELAAGLWICFTMIYLYQRRFPEEGKDLETPQEGGRK